LVYPTYTKTAGLGSLTYIRDGYQLSDASPWTVAATVQYDFALSGTVGAYLRGEDRYGSQNHGNFAFQDPTTAAYNRFYLVNGATNQVDLRAGATFKGIDLSLFVNNLLNDHPILAGNLNLADASYGEYTLRPRTAGLTASYRW